MDTLTSPAYRIVSNHGFAERRQRISNDQNALFATQPFAAGAIIADFSAGTIATEPTYLTVQVGVARHITLQPEFLQYINHSCDPNVFFNTTTMQLEALKAIGADEELRFFYPSTEWNMIQAFECYCGCAACIGTIKGAASLSKKILDRYRLTDFIQQQLAGKNTRQKVA